MKIKQRLVKLTETKPIKLLRTTIERWQSVNSPQLAAALAYHTIFSLAPLLIISIYVAGLVLGRADVQMFVTDQIQTLMGEETTKIILSMIENLRQDNSGLIASIIGFITLIFGATRIFTQLEVTLNIIFESEEKEEGGILDELKKRALSFGMMVGVSILFLVSLLFSTGLSLLKNLFADLIPPTEVVIDVINYAIPVLMATILISIVFKFLPEAHLSWHNALVGGFLTAILFTIGQLLISYYLGNSSISSAYGAAGSLLVILVWIYYSAQIFYFGAAFTNVYAAMQKEST